MDDGWIGCLVYIIVIIIVIFIGVYALGAIYATMIFAGYNIFYFVDTLLTVNPDFNPFIVWGLFGVIIGIAIGLWRAAAKNNVNYLKIFSIILPVLIIAGASLISKPLAISYSRTFDTSSKIVYGVIIADVGANIRDGPSTNSKIIDKLPKNYEVKILNHIQGESWHQIQYIKNNKTKTGYIYSAIVKLKGSIADLP